MRSLLPGKERRIRVELVGKTDLDFNPLVAQEVQASAAMRSPLPVVPEHGGRSGAERMQQHADLARLLGGGALPLALLA
jgi:hypothetical protein